MGDKFPEPTISPDSPKDVDLTGFPVDAQGRPGANPIKRFDDYSWRLFVAVNWPSTVGKRGVPDKTKKLGDTTTPTTWETWKAAFELFQPRGAQPSEWDSFDAVSPCPDVAKGNGGKVKALASFSKGGLILEDFNEAGLGVAAGPLIAQNRTYVRYEIHVNQIEYDFIRGDPSKPETALYLRTNLEKQAPLSFRAGAIVLKAAWRELKQPSEKAALDRYYHVDAMLVNPKTGQCEKKTMALVGLHLVQKTPTRPQWIWSTFEHVDNVVVPADAPEGTKASFNNPSGGQKSTDPDVDIEPDPINAANPPNPDPDPVQVIRENPIPASTVKTNDLYRNHELVKNTVWKNYQLVMTQWPTQPDTGGMGVPFPSNKVANVTMETYFQGSSCIQCHAKALDADFAWFLKLRAFPPKSAVAESATRVMEGQKTKKSKKN
jgi:hypothetical protein